MDEKENWTRNQEMGFGNWLCDDGQVIILSGPWISHVDTEVGVRTCIWHMGQGRL